MHMVTPSPASRPERHVTIDLSVPHRGGGYDPEAPQRIATLLVSGRLRTGHTWDLADPSAPVWIDEAADVHPGGAAVADLRCPRCVTKLDIGRIGTDTVAILEHQRGCRWLRKFLARRAS